MSTVNNCFSLTAAANRKPGNCRIILQKNILVSFVFRLECLDVHITLNQFRGNLLVKISLLL